MHCESSDNISLYSEHMPCIFANCYLFAKEIIIHLHEMLRIVQRLRFLNKRDMVFVANASINH